MHNFLAEQTGHAGSDVATVSIHDLISNVGDTVGPAATSKSIQIISYTDIHLPATVQADAVQLGRVLYKLIENAIRFTEQDGTVSIEAVSRGIDDNVLTLYLIIEDTGTGMSSDQLADVLRSMSEAGGDADRVSTDSDFGLRDCMRYAQSMQGTIRVNSEPGVGSRFTLEISLPVVDAKSLAVPDITGLRILNAAGDICNLREIIGNSIRQANAAIKFVAGAEAAINEINRAIDEGCAYHVLMFCRLWTDETRRQLYERIMKIPDSERPAMLVLSPQGRFDNQYSEAVTMVGNPMSLNRIIKNLAVATGRTGAA